MTREAPGEGLEASRSAAVQGMREDEGLPLAFQIAAGTDADDDGMLFLRTLNSGLGELRAASCELQRAAAGRGACG